MDLRGRYEEAHPLALKAGEECGNPGIDRILEQAHGGVALPVEAHPLMGALLAN
jgi:hypothetical protein